MNIILITSDQQRCDSLGIYGSDFVHTPNFDRLGKEGVVFDRAYCPNTVCTPSRVSMMTGMHLSRHGSYNVGCMTPETAPFVSSLLRTNGYRTHHIGKAHWSSFQTPDSREYQFTDLDQCKAPFRDFYGFETAELCIGHGTWSLHGHYGQWVKEQGENPESFDQQTLFDRDPNGTAEWDLPVRLHSGTWLAERTAAFLETHDRKQPFFLNLGFPDPHHPHIVPHDFAQRVDPAKVPLPLFEPDREKNPAPHLELFRNDGLQSSRFRGPFDMAGQGPTYWGEYSEDEEKVRTTRAYYYSMVQLMDEQLGQILNTLDRLKLADDTLIIFTSDHGEMLGDHHIFQKGPLVFEQVTRVPLLVRYPGKIPPGRSEEIVSLIDLAPTFLDWVGIEDPQRRDGLSLRGLLEQGEEIDRHGVRIEYKEEADRIRYRLWVTNRWKLAVYPGESFGELYDLKDDPEEYNNLYDDPACAAVKNELLTAMLADMERSDLLNPRQTRV